MAGNYLTDLAAVCRGAGLNVIEVDGWQTRARSSGGYGSGRPDHVMVHHTASGPASDGWPDVEYITHNSDIAPISNLYLSRDGTVYVCAAGATNTNGSGHDPCGMVPDDNMNVHAVGIEAANDGVGERWPDAQLYAYLELCVALCDAYRIPVANIHAHWEYAPTRKQDPAGPPRPVSGHPAPLSWDMDAFRADVFAVSTTTPAPIPTPSTPGEHMYYRDDRAEGWQIWMVAADAHGQVWTCPINDLPDSGKWDKVQPIVGDPPTVAFTSLVTLMDAQNRPAP